MCTDKGAENEAGQQAESDGSPMDAAERVGDEFAALQLELDDAKGKTLRLMADFQNYQRRALQNEVVAKGEGAAKVASSVVTVLDHLDLALTQDPAKATVEQMMAGVKVIREELLKVLGQSGVTMIRPNGNDEFVPGKHEAVMQQPGDNILPGRINAVFQPGYVISMSGVERVLRPAKVSVSPVT